MEQSPIPMQRVWNEVDFRIEYLEARGQDLNECAKQLVRPFDLSQAPLFRVAIAEIGEDQYMLFLDVHHIISDGASAGVLIRDFMALYTGAKLPELKVQYRDYTNWHNRFLQSGEVEQQENYWLGVFSDFVPDLNLPTDYPRPEMQSYEGNIVKFNIQAATVRKLGDLAADKGLTLYMVLLAAYYVLLSKYSAQEDIVVGTPIAGRLHSDFEDTIGMFSNMLALRNHPAGHKTFSEFMEEVKSNSLIAYENQGYPFEELVKKLGIKRDVSRSPLFDTVFVLQNTPVPSLEYDNIVIKDFDYTGRSALFDLLLEAYEQFGQLSFNFYYCAKLFSEDTMNQMAQDYVKILAYIAENQTMTLAEIEIRESQNKKPSAARQNISFHF